MALFIFFIKYLYKLIYIQILIESIILITNNGLLIKSVNAQANIRIDSGPPLNLTNDAPSKVIFKNINNPILLPCKPSEEENILVTWYRNNEKIYPSRRINDFQVYENGSLKLPPNDKSNGIYQCLVNDTAIQYGYGALLSHHVKVEYPVTKRNSSFTNQTSLIATIGRSFLIDCPIISVPNANITWSFGNITITSKKVKDNRFIQLANGTLFIKNITSNSAGKYKCTVKNDFAAKNQRQFSCNLNIIENNFNSNKFNLNQLVIPLQAKELFVSNGKNLKLFCDTYSSDINIEWWFKSIYSNDNLFEQKIINNSRELEIINASSDNHEGYYKCTTGKDSQVFKVVVSRPPKILTPLLSYESSIAASVFFNCTVDGNPKPKITWYRNGIKLEDNYTTYINSNILRIYSLDLADTGVYQCFANNIAGEDVSNGYIRLRNNIENIPERPFNVQCYPINYKKVNITFDINQPGLLTMINVYMARMGNSSALDKWIANIPIPLDSKKYIILDHDKAILQPFMLFLRGMVVTSFLKINKGNTEKTIDPSSMSEGIPCATQGLEIHPVFFQNGIFIWWSQLPKDSTIKYYIIQFLNNDSPANPTAATKFASEIIGTTIPLNSYVNRNEIESKLIKIALIDHVQNTNTITEEDGVLSLILPTNCTGILIPNTSKITVRVIAITKENENVPQDYRFLEWKKIEDISEGHDIAIKILDIESRKINFYVESSYDLKCIKSCYRSVGFQMLLRESMELCRNITVHRGLFSIGSLKPKTAYELHFEICHSKQVIGSTNIFTIADPPGPVNNHKVMYSDNGYELSWEPPVNPNGKIDSYLISWTYRNQTFNSSVRANVNKFSFPNIDRNEKFNITIRVAGESGTGLPIYIDLHKVASNIILPENKSTMDQTLAIIIGVLLSLICIMAFIYIFIAHRKRLKNNQPLSVNTNLTTNTSGDIEMLNNPCTTIIDVDNQNLQAIDFGIKNSKKPSDNRLDEIHEMQTLIPHQSPNSKKFPNGNAIYYQENNDDQLNKSHCSNSNSAENILLINRNPDESTECPIKLCTSTPFPIRKKSDLNAYLINQQKEQELQSPMIVLPKYNSNNNNNNNNNNINKKSRKINKISSSPNFHSNDQKIVPTEISHMNGKFCNSSNDEFISEIENKKHSNPLLSLDIKLANGYEPTTEENSIDSTTNKFLSDNGKLKLIIDDNCDNKTYSEISPQTTTSNNDSKNNSNCTETTLLNFENENPANIISNNNQNYNWNHKIPIIDPNG